MVAEAGRLTLQSVWKSHMIRTALSFCLLFGALAVASRWLSDSAHLDLKAAGKTAPAFEPQSDGAKPLPQPAGHTLRIVDDRAVRLVGFDEPLPEGSDDVQLTSGVKARIEDEESASEEATPDTVAPIITPPKEPEIAMTPQLLEVRSKIREALAYYYFRPENVALRSPWGAMHAMIAYGVDSELIAGDKRVNAIGYLCYNGVCNGQQLFYTTNGKLQARIGPGVQGHPGQFLAMLAQSRVKTDFPLLIEGQKFNVAELIQYEKDTCRPKTELTFKLIAFSHYLKSDEKWKSNDGQDWDMQRLIKEELAQPIVGAACGGTHRMTGFSYAVRRREQRGEPIVGEWKRAKRFVDDFHEYAFRLQNPDGSFSTTFFAGRADDGPATKRLETTGHITEWLAFSLEKEQLVEPRMLKSVYYLSNLLIDNRDEKWGIGPLGHGLHALAIYDERIFGGKPGTRAVELAEVKKSRKSVER
jgi:hypothetical protein